MSLDLRVASTIAGHNPKAIRDMLRRCHGYLTETWLRRTLGLNDKEAYQIASELLRSGYVESCESRESYRVTRKGRDLMRASAAARIQRKTARLALDEFMDRVHHVNKNSAFLYTIAKVVVFGSFLGDGERLGDVDVALDLKRRVPFAGNWVEVFRRHAWRSGRSFRTFEEEIDWPRREVILALKAKKRSISIQSWFSFVEMEKASDFRYRVLLGDPREIRGELVRADRELEKGVSDAFLSG